ncbi:hypothetical protein F4810DRAFT_248183 [Camillea tinctor]|nr:hypothetical protein F4810DRAFT_248183 [Camillea tinctor]
MKDLKVLLYLVTSALLLRSRHRYMVGRYPRGGIASFSYSETPPMKDASETPSFNARRDITYRHAYRPVSLPTTLGSSMKMKLEFLFSPI